MHFILRCLATVIALGVAVWAVPGIEVVSITESWEALVICGIVLALVNTCVKPILKFLGTPITILTLGLFYLVICVAMLYLMAWVVGEIFGIGFVITDFGSALVGSLIISVVCAVVTHVLEK